MPAPKRVRVPLTLINISLPSTQALTALLVLHLLDRHPGLTEYELRERIQAMGGGEFWRPSKGTISKVVRDLLREGQLEGDWVDPEGRRKRPLRITDEGKARLRSLKTELHAPIRSGIHMLQRTLREVYGG